MLYYTTNKPRDHEPLWKSSGLGEVVPQDHIKEFHNKIIVPLGQRDGWKRVKWTNGEEVFELWLGTRVAVPANGVGQWETYHAPRHSLPTADQPLKENDWALTTEIFDSRFSHAPLG